MGRFSDRVVIVTGSASGIGLATALRFGREGAGVGIVDRDPARVDDACRRVEAEGARAIALTCDVSRPEEVTAAVDTAIRALGRLDVVVNNAGVMVFRELAELTREDWIGVLEVALLGAFYFVKEAFRVMSRGGAIVNVASVHAIETTVGVAPYAAAKAAMLSLTRSAALEGKSRGLRVNAVLPGAIDTPMLWNNPNVKAGLENIERTDVGKPEDIAAVICFLASDDAGFVQGDAMLVDGGRLSRL